MKIYDYIIVGAGSAGCALAARLSEDPSVRVLLVEAGPWDKDPMIKLPLGWGRIVPQRRHDWMYSAGTGLAGRELACLRGKVIGGCSSVNAMAYVRGHAHDYDGWAASGLPGWSYADVLPYFRRGESWEGGADAWRGGDGPVRTCLSRFDDPVIQAYFEAGSRLGHPVTRDYNGASQHGMGIFQMTVRDGRRSSAAEAYLHPARSRPNLTIQVNTFVTGLEFSGDRAVGIAFECGRESGAARAEREVILCGGVFNSPQLLMLAGIGDPDDLRALGIAPQVALRGVGKNLQDHLCANVEYARRQPGTFHRQMRLDRTAFGLLEAYTMRTGMWTDLPSGWMAFLKSEACRGELPDVQLLFRCVPSDAGPHLRPFIKPYEDGFVVRATLLRPESAGRVRLRSADPHDAPDIRFDFLSRDHDWRTLRAGLRLVRELSRQGPLQEFVARETSPGADAVSDAQLDEYIRKTASTSFHPMGTCRMGPAAHADAVLDEHFRVHGVQGLRVVDASAMPHQIGGNLQATVMMMAEKAADSIRGAALPSARPRAERVAQEA